MKNTVFAGVSIAKYAPLLIAISGAAMLAACSKAAPLPEPVRAVRVITVASSGLVAQHEYAGEVRARVESRLGFRVAGKIIQRQAEVGQRVKVGQILAQIDPQDYQLAAQAASAQLAAAATNRDLAAADYKRYKDLKEQNFISGAELERRDTVLKAAQAQYDQARAQLSTQGNQARYTALVADAAGIVTAVEAEPGQVVAAGTPVLRVAVDGPRDVVFSVPEDQLRSISVGQIVAVAQWASGGQASGTVREVAASADPVTRTYAVKVALDAVAMNAQAPALGSTVNVIPASAQRQVQAIKLPTSALLQSGANTTVWLLDTVSMTVKSAVVQVATADGNEAVIASGIKPGDVVVSAGVHVLSPGQKVTLYKEKSPLAGVSIAKSAMDTVASSSVVPAALAPAPAVAAAAAIAPTAAVATASATSAK